MHFSLDFHDSMFGRHKERSGDNDFNPSKWQVKRATRTRMCWALLTSLLLLISLTFLILVEIGSIRKNRILSNIYFIRLDLSNIIPVNVPNAVLINSIAQTLGLHDYYTVGLWNFCEGNNGVGFTDCSKSKPLYWFDPVEILQSELLQGATSTSKSAMAHACSATDEDLVALPSEINKVLDLIRLVSHWMFGLFLTAACLTFLMVFLVPLAVYSRWASLPLMTFTFLSALFTTVASVIATVMVSPPAPKILFLLSNQTNPPLQFIIMKDAITQVQELNIGAEIGVEMFAFMWIAAGSAILAWIIQFSLCCCCASRRDVKTGRKRGSMKAWRDSDGGGMGEKPAAHPPPPPPPRYSGSEE